MSSLRLLQTLGRPWGPAARWPGRGLGLAWRCPPRSKATSSAGNGALYRDTVSLPRTDFPMKLAGQALLNKELEIQEVCNFSGLYDWQKERKSKKEFCLHDGPPYANGDPHVGHVLNKVLKDITNRYYVMRGYKVHFVPGWDCHGLPIELKALTESEVNDKTLSPLDIRKKAREFAEKAIEKQRASFIRWGIMANWKDDCYSTFSKEYEAEQLKVFYNMHEKGFIYQDYKPVFWSPSTRTALAEAELEYNPAHTSKAVHVKFPLAQVPPKLASLLGPDATVSLVIWTTQPWTLPANEAVCFMPNSTYSVVKCGQTGELLLLAADRVESLATALRTTLETLHTFAGSDLQGGTCSHPTIAGKIAPLLPAAHVTMLMGTGLVHTAPAHGADDFSVAVAHKLPVRSLVDEEGLFTAEAGEELQGKAVLEEGNEAVVAQLRAAGCLLHEAACVHSYPFDWRSHQPVLVRASSQWFINTDTLRDRAQEVLKKVKVVPSASSGGVQAALDRRSFWCISRQRCWGVPIPVFYDRQTREPLINKHTVEHVCGLVEEHGSDCWWSLPLEELLPKSVREKSGVKGDVEFVRGDDIMDIWFDSGTSWASVLEGRISDVDQRADLYLEGKDQLGGWFYSSLLTSVAVKKKAPYKALLVHGFAVSESGKKMSKSLGNVVDPDVVINGGKDLATEPPYGADVLRWWVAESNVFAEVAIGPKILNAAQESISKIRNTVRFMLGNLHDFDTEQHAVQAKDMLLLDQFVLHRLEDFSTKVTEAYELYDYSRATRIIMAFLINDLSSFYFSIIKDRLYCEEKQGHKRRSCQTVMHTVLEAVNRALAPILPHLAEEIFQQRHKGKDEDVESVFRSGWVEASAGWRKPGVVEAMEMACKIRDTFLGSIVGNNAAEYDTIIAVEPGLLFELLELLQTEEVSSTSQLSELMMSSRTTLVTSLLGSLPLGATELQGVCHIDLPEVGISERQSFKLAVLPASGVKCPRCRKLTSTSEDNPCHRCTKVLQELKAI
uniref:Isoleucine--tRNA ligase, mitochondrial n=1 Tax=Petromyzon marinus TaxID=7757 RepID=A0AAJ7SS81_PETMA|nr:isoleucine--tRNA ligase, mitochondrial isoform X1 [Petromyzon marinus]